jgi:hypothetical protein
VDLGGVETIRKFAFGVRCVLQELKGPEGEEDDPRKGREKARNHGDGQVRDEERLGPGPKDFFVVEVSPWGRVAESPKAWALTG